jgi:hypothetical protein
LDCFFCHLHYSKRLLHAGLIGGAPVAPFNPDRSGPIRSR